MAWCRWFLLLYCRDDTIVHLDRFSVDFRLHRSLTEWSALSSDMSWSLQFSTVQSSHLFLGQPLHLCPSTLPCPMQAHSTTSLLTMCDVVLCRFADGRGRGRRNVAAQSSKFVAEVTKEFENWRRSKLTSGQWSCGASASYAKTPETIIARYTRSLHDNSKGKDISKGSRYV